jgi:hypothetical protein
MKRKFQSAFFRSASALALATALVPAKAPAAQVNLKQIGGINASVATALGIAPTGSGSMVLGTSPTLTAPNLGTPTNLTLTNATGLAISSGLTGAGTGVLTALGNAVSGSGSLAMTNSPTLTTPNLGTPSAATLTNATGLPLSTGLSGAGAGVLSALAIATNTANGIPTLDASGNLGIGTTSPAANIHAYAASGTVNLRIQSNAGIGDLATDGTNVYLSTSNSSSLLLSAGTTAGSLILYAGGNPRLDVTNDGSIGIGTTSPAYNLDVTGTGRFTGNAVVGGTLGVTGGLTAASFTGSGAGLSSVPLSATLTKWSSPMDPPFNAACDGSSDDSTALQSWLNTMGTLSTSYAADFTGVLPARTCAFATGLTFSGKNAVSIIGMGQNSLLRYIGTSTTTTPITWGATTGNCEMTSLTLKDFYISSATHMTAGSAMEFDDVCAIRMENLGIQDNAGGSYGNWASGLVFKGGNQIYLFNNIISGSLDAVLAYGDDAAHSSTQLTDLRITGGLIIGGIIGVDLGGNVGGANFDGMDILGNGTQLRISQDAVSIPNLQVFIGPTADLDATHLGAGVDIDVEDPGGNNSILQISGSSIASAGEQCVFFGGGVHWVLDWVGGTLANCANTGLYISNTAVVRGQVANVVVNPNAAGFSPSSGFGIDCGSSGSPGLTFSGIRFLGTWPSGYVNNCAVSSFYIPTTSTPQTNLPISNSTGPSVAWQFDVSNQTPMTITNGGNAVLPAGSGLIIIDDTTSTGDVSMWLCGGIACALVSSSKGAAVASTITPAAGKYSVAVSSGNYVIFNNMGSTINFTVSLLRTRAAN